MRRPWLLMSHRLRVFSSSVCGATEARQESARLSRRFTQAYHGLLGARKNSVCGLDGIVLRNSITIHRIPEGAALAARDPKLRSALLLRHRMPFESFRSTRQIKACVSTDDGLSTHRGARFSPSDTIISGARAGTYRAGMGGRG